MAKNNTQRFEPTVTLNSKAAEHSLEGLRIKAKQVGEAIREAGKIGDSDQVTKLSKELKSIESSQRKIKSQTYDYNTVLKNLNTSNITSLEKTTRSLRSEIKKLTPGTQEFVNKTKQLDLVRNRLDQLNGRVRQTHSWMSRAGASFNKYFGMATAAIASITGISFALRSAAQEAAKMDDIYSDVIKTTGLLRKEVVQLNEEFKKLNTRTSREALNLLARDAGKLGIEGSANILEFVRAANQINVALGEDLGEGAIRSIGKLAEVFKLSGEMGIEKSFLSIGSAINAVGQASTASEAYLVDFTQRIAGVAYQSGMSLQNVIGFASALDQAGQKVEMSATAFQKLLMKMFSDTASFAQMANMEVGEFAKLLRTDVNQALITVLTSLGNKGGFAQLVPIFQDMGLDGARAVGVLSSMATNINLVTEAQALSNKEFQLATSLTQEYNTKNENMQAQLEKAKKAFSDQVIELGEKLSPAFLKSTKATTLFIKAIMNYGTQLLILSGVIAALVIRQKALIIVQGIWNTIATAGKIVSLALSYTMALLQGNTYRAAKAWTMLNATMSASAIGAIITAVVVLGTALYKLITYQSDLTKATKEYYKETEKAKREAGDLLKILEESVLGSEEYKGALSNLVDLYGPYINHLIDEKGYLTDIKQARKEINTAIEQTIGLRIKEAAISDIVTESLGAQANYYEKMVKNMVKQGGISEAAARIYATSFTNAIKEGRQWNTLVQELFEQVGKHFNYMPFQNYAKEYNKMLGEMAATEKKFAFLTPKKSGTTGETPAQKKARIAKEEAEALAASAEEKERLRKAAEERLKLREELFKKEGEKLNSLEAQRQLSLKKLYYEQALTIEQFDALMQDTTLEYLTKRNSLYLEYGKDNTAIQASYYDELIKLADVANKSIDESIKLIDYWMDKIKKRKEEEISDEGDDQELKYWSDLAKKASDIKLSIAKKDARKMRDQELKELKQMLDAKLLTQKEYESELKRIKTEAALSTANDINNVVQAAAELFNAIKDIEFNKLEQEKEKELALYGDSADARAEIENKYEKKKMDLQKQYADMDMAIKIAQALSSGAVAAIQAYATLGPIAGPIAAAFIGLTTAMSVATIVAQRNAIKNQASPSSSSSSSGGSMTVNEYYEGGFTGTHKSDRKAVGIVHANEWVAPASMIRSNPIVFANLERQRASKYAMSSPPKQFASGGFTSPQSTGQTDALLATLISEVQALRKTPMPAYVALDQFNAQQETKRKFKSEGSL